MSTHYITWGSVRGDCGHRHQTPATAQKCCDQDQKGCKGHGTGHYSDRFIMAVEDGMFRVLDDIERSKVEEYENAKKRN